MPGGRGTTNRMIGTHLSNEETIKPIVAFRGYAIGHYTDAVRMAPYRHQKECIEPEAVQTARCDANEKLGLLTKLLTGKFLLHKAPNPSCNCGLFAYYEPDFDKFYGMGIGAIVSCWGPVQFHKDGLRAANMKIIAILDPEGHKGAINSITAKYLAHIYKVPLVKTSSAKEYASEFGRLITNDDYNRWEEEFRPEFKRIAMWSAVKAFLSILLYFLAMFSGVIFSYDSSMLVWAVSILIFFFMPSIAFRNITTVSQYRKQRKQE